MGKRILTLFALSLALFVTPSWATTCIGGEGLSCPNTFSPTNTTNTYDFSASGDGILIVQFDTVLTTFVLTVTVNHTIDPIDLTVFPVGTACVIYEFNGSRCDEYDFTGNAGGPNGVPVKNKDYKSMITLTLEYFTNQTVHNPAFGHAPETNDTTMYNEDILTAYSSSPVEDPTMGGKLPGLSSVVALDEPGNEIETFCFVTPTPNQTFSAAQVKEIEIAFQFSSDPGGSCPITGTPIRDKTARFSLSTVDPTTGNIVFPPLLDKEEGDKFHWDNQGQANEFDLSTVGLKTNVKYTITVFSSKFSPPQTISFTLTP
jgi:hypothetical protein